MPAVNWIFKRLRKVRKKYIVDLPPEQADTMKQFGQEMFELGLEFSSKTISDTASKTLNEMIKEQLNDREM